MDLEKWKDKKIEIEQEKRYTNIIAQAEEYAEERLNELETECNPYTEVAIWENKEVKKCH